MDNNENEIVIRKGVPIPPLHRRFAAINWEELPVTKALVQMDIGDSIELPYKIYARSNMVELCRKIGIKVTVRTSKGPDGKPAKVEIWRVEGVTAPPKKQQQKEPPKLFPKVKSKRLQTLAKFVATAVESPTQTEQTNNEH